MATQMYFTSARKYPCLDSLRLQSFCNLPVVLVQSEAHFRHPVSLIGADGRDNAPVRSQVTTLMTFGRLAGPHKATPRQRNGHSPAPFINSVQTDTPIVEGTNWLELKMSNSICSESIRRYTAGVAIFHSTLWNPERFISETFSHVNFPTIDNSTSPINSGINLAISTSVGGSELRISGWISGTSSFLPCSRHIPCSSKAICKRQSFAFERCGIAKANK